MPRLGRVPTYNGTPITLVNLATHTSALPREQPGGAPHRPVFVWPTREQRWSYLSTATLKAALARRRLIPTLRLTCWLTRWQPHPANPTRSYLKNRLRAHWG